MDQYNWGIGLTPGTAITTVLALLGVVYLVVWQVRRQRARGDSNVQGTLLLQMEVHGMLIAHIAMLTAEERGRMPRYQWHMSEINRDDFPDAQMTELPFTDIVVTQRQKEPDLLTICVIDRGRGFIRKNFYWIKEAPIGTRAGFARQLLLPQNLVLKYVDSESF